MAARPPSDTDLLAFFQETFACPADVAASIGRRAQDRSYPVAAVILKQGDQADATYLVVVGKANALSYGAEGQVVMLHEFGRGDFFGALSLTEPAPEAADVVAVEAVRASVFRAPDFLGLIEAYGCVGLVVSRMLLKQLRASSIRIVENTTLSAPGRIYLELLRLARLGDGRHIKPMPVFSTLATRVHSTRETVSRTISALERRGILRREPGGLYIVAPQRLEEMAV